MSELTPQETVRLSKLLSYILRHGAVKENVTIAPNGYIAVKDLVKKNKL
jgi:2'-phosphotransferase